MRGRVLCIFISLLPATTVAGAVSSPQSSRRRIQPACESRTTPLLSNGARHFIASALSGAAGVTALAPIEVVRIQLMVNSNDGVRGAVRALGGVRGAFRGNTADALAAAIKVGMTMPAFKLYKQWLTAAAQRYGHLEEDAPLPQWAVFFAGAFAGCTATIVAFPLDVARTRLAMECSVDMSLATCLYGIGEREGIKALYQGLTATVAGALPFSAVKLTTYDLLRSRALAKDDSVSLPLGQSAVLGAIAGVVAATTCFPLEVVRRRQMLGEFASISTMGAISTIVRVEGMEALFAGVGLNMFKTGMSNALGFALYELTKDMLSVDGRTPPWRQHKSVE